jgi:hypothetical protein
LYSFAWKTQAYKICEGCHGLGYFGILLAISWPRIFLDTFAISWPRIFWDTYGNVMAKDILGLVWFMVIKGDSLGNNLSTNQHQLMDQ